MAGRTGFAAIGCNTTYCGGNNTFVTCGIGLAIGAFVTPGILILLTSGTFLTSRTILGGFDRLLCGDRLWCSGRYSVAVGAMIL